MKTNKKISIAILNESPAYKVLGAYGTAGDSLKAHKVNADAILLVRDGSISYKTSVNEINLTAGGTHHIPSEEIHEVHCETDAKFFLVVPKAAKMIFTK